MTEDINQKVINIFSKHKAQKPLEDESKVVDCGDGVQCITIKLDKHGKNLDKDEIIKNANDCEYIVKVLVDAQPNPYINNYKVTGKKLISFIHKFIKKKKEGVIIEVDKYFPEDLA